MDGAPQSNLDYLRWRWTLLPAVARRFWKRAGVLLLLLWLAGALVASHSVATIAAKEPAARAILAALVGPGGLALGWAEFQEIFQETAQNPAPWWMGAVAANVGLAILLGSRLFSPAGTKERNHFHQQRHRLEQGRLEGEEILERVPTERGVPLAIAGGREQATVSLPYQGGEGHVLVVAPTRAGKGLHETDVLLSWPGPLICIDPKLEQWERTAGVRQWLGPVYCLPGYSLPLADYYDLRDGDDLAELHFHFLKPWQSREPIFANKSKPLFSAVADYAAAHGLDAVRTLLDAAGGDPVAVLLALERVARRQVRQFTNGLGAREYVHDRFATSAYGTFTTQLGDYQKHVDTIAPLPGGPPPIPRNWAARNGSLYITYSLNDLRGVSGVVAAVLAALMRHHVNGGRGQRLLVAIDEFPAVELANANTYLSTVGGAGVTMLLYAQNVAQLRALYGDDGAQALVGNCKHQLWYPAADAETARFVSDLYGTALIPTETRTLSQNVGGETQRLQQGVSESLVERAALSPTAVMSLPKEQVVVQTESDRLYRFLGRRLNPLPRLNQLPPPPLLPEVQAPGERVYTDWQAGADGAPPAGDAAVTVAEEAAGGNAPDGSDVPGGGDTPGGENTPLRETEGAIGETVAADGQESLPVDSPEAPETETAAAPEGDPPAGDPPSSPPNLLDLFGKDTKKEKGDDV